MSFRVRLIVFFVLIVALPMVALAVLVTQISSDSANGKTDARLDAGVRTATNLYDQARADSGRVANDLARETADDPESIAAIRAGAVGDVVSLARIYADRDGISYVSIVDSEGHETVAGDSRPVATAEVDLVDDQGDQVGTITTSTTTRDQLLREIESTTGEEAALLGPRGPVSGTADVEAGDLPASGEAKDLQRGDEEVRVAATAPLGAEQVRVALFAPTVDEGFLGSRPNVAIALIAFFAVALIAVALILRSLQGYVREMLGAAKRIGDGDFSTRVPVSGRDEMAGLASEFNKMSGRLADQMDELRRQRIEIEKSTRQDRGCVRLRARPPGSARDPGGHRGRRLHGRLRAGGAQRPRRLGGRVGEGDRTGAGGGAGRREPGASRARAGGGLAGRGVRVRQLAGPARVNRGAGGRDDDRPGGHAVFHGGTRRVPVSRRAGGGVGRERGPARARLRAGCDRRPHRARQQPRLPRRDGEGGGARRALPPRGFAC